MREYNILKLSSVSISEGIKVNKNLFNKSIHVSVLVSGFSRQISNYRNEAKKKEIAWKCSVSGGISKPSKLIMLLALYDKKHAFTEMKKMEMMAMEENKMASAAKKKHDMKGCAMHLNMAQESLMTHG